MVFKNISKIFFSKKKFNEISFTVKLLMATSVLLLVLGSTKSIKSNLHSSSSSSRIASVLELTKLVSNTTPESGETFTYTLQYSCSGTTEDCLGTYITDPLPPEVEFVSIANSVHIAISSYNSSTHTVSFTFIDPFPSGSSGQVEVNVAFPNGISENGAVASNSATIDATNATAVTSGPVISTVTASSKTDFVKYVGGGGAVGGTISYTFKVCNTGDGIVENGTLGFDNVSIVDTFPANTTFLGAINAQGSSYVYDASNHSITFTLPDSLGPGECFYPKVSLGVPSPSWNVGDEIINDVTIYYTPHGESPTSTGVTSSYLLTAPNFEAEAIKTVSNSSLYQGNSDAYEIYLDISGTEDLDDLCLIDTIPDGLVIQKIHHGGYYYGGLLGADNVITISYETNLGGPYVISGSPFSLWESGPIDVYSDLGLPSDNSEYITVINWCYGDVYSGFGMYRNIVLDFLVKTDAPIGNLTNCTDQSSSTPGASYINGCATFEVLSGVAGFRPSLRKYIRTSTGTWSETHTESLGVGDTATFRLRVRNSSSSIGNLPDPIAADFLPEGLEYISGSWGYSSGGTGAPNPIFFEQTDFNGTGRSLLKWEWTGASSFSLSPNENLYVTFDAIVNNLAPPGTGALINEFAILNNTSNFCSGGSKDTDDDDLDSDGDTTEEFCFKDILLNINSTVSIESEKLVKGQLDSTYTKYPAVAHSVPGGIADYILEVRNIGNIAMDSIVIIDIFPSTGDIGVVDTTPRDSRWQPNLVSTVSAPSGVTVYYSLEENPCRVDEGFVVTGPVGCASPNWSTTPPADLTTVRSVRFDFGNTILVPNDTIQLSWAMRVPVNIFTSIGAQPDSIAWNSFGFIGRRTDNGQYVLPSEPVKVGVDVDNVVPNVYGDFVWNDVNQNGIQDGGEPGIDGVRVELYKDNDDGVIDPVVDTLINFTLTANSGYYLFPNLIDGDYYSVFYKPAVMEFTTNDIGADNDIDSDGIPSSLNGLEVAITPIITLDNFAYDLSWDMGLYASSNGAVGDYVWNDANGNGIQDEAASEGINGVEIYLYNNASPSSPIGTVITSNDANGNPGYYLFSEITPGNYFVELNLPSGVTYATQGLNGSSDLSDSDFNSSTNRTEVFSVAGGNYDNSWDAGLILSGVEICDNGIDDDGDGLIDNFDPECIDLSSCCVEPSLVRNGSFEDGSFSVNASVVNPNNAMVVASFGGLPLDDFDADGGIYWIEDPGRATDGNRFLYLPEANVQGKCVYQKEELFGGDLTACATYQITFDIAGFDENATELSTNYVIEFFYKNDIGNLEQEMVQDEFTFECSSIAAPNPIPTSDWNNLNWMRVSGTIDLPPPNNIAYTQIEMLISISSGGGALIDNVCVNKVSENVSMNVEGTNPTCSSTGMIQIISTSAGDRYEYNITGFDDLPLTYFSASNTISSFPQTVVNNILYTDPTTTYFIRVYESGDCFKDTSIVINQLGCVEICSDGIDNDEDGLVDQFDDDCPCGNTGSFYGNCPPPCEYVPPVGSIGFDLTTEWTSNVDVTDISQLFTGDLDGEPDGVPEVVAMKDLIYNVSETNSIYVLSGTDGSLKYHPNTLSIHNRNKGLALGDVDKDGLGEFYYVTADDEATGNSRKIACYEYDPAGINPAGTGTGSFTLQWTSSSQITCGLSGGELFAVEDFAVGLVDFNYDGIPEVYVGNEIYNAITGQLISTGGTNSIGSWNQGGFSTDYHVTAVTIAADVLPDSFCPDCDGIELIAGNQIYSVNIGSGIQTVVQQAPGGLPDGTTALADYDLDGDLDAVITSNDGTNSFLYIWDLQTSAQIGGTHIVANTTSIGYHPINLPIIADFDGDDRPEIGVCGHLVFQVVEDHTVDISGTGGVLWNITTTDVSGQTGASVFDFNGDGVSEVVYRDEDSLRVMSGPTGVNLAAFPCGSATGGEYPVIADIDNDGQTEILCNCTDSFGSTRTQAFKSNLLPWVPTRKVWNQYAYFNVNINDDLTIPRQQQSQHLLGAPTAGTTGVLNNFLQQSPMLDDLGNELFPSADLSISTVVDASLCVSNSTIDLEITISNNGSSIAPSDIPLAIYDADPRVSNANLLGTTISASIIDTASSIIINYTLDVSSLTFPTNIYIVVNDDGNTSRPYDFSSDFPVTSIGECDFENNIEEIYVEDGCVEICNDGIDNDGDGLVDYLDSDCDCPTSYSNAFNIDFGNGVPVTGSGLNAGDQILYSNVGIIGNQSVDIRATVTNLTNLSSLGDHGNQSGGVLLPSVRVAAGTLFSSTIQYEVFELGTTTPISGSFEIEIVDLDLYPTNRQESITVPQSEVELYSLNSPTNVSTSFTSGNINFIGTASQSGADPEGAVKLTYTDVNQFSVTYRMEQMVDGSNAGSAGFGLNGSNIQFFTECFDEICDDGIDNDNDGLIDENCIEICNNGIDDDLDGLTDCEDPDCYLAANSGDSDNDNDGIGDYCDLDDDNDGIPDVDEGCEENPLYFPNAEKGYLFQQQPTEIYLVDIPTGASTYLQTLTFTFNGVAINELDGLLWGVNFSTGDLLTLDPVTFSIVNTFGNYGSMVSAAYDPIQKVYVLAGDPTTYVIDADPVSPTYGIELYSFATADFLPDIVYNGDDGFMYGVKNNDNNLYRIDIVSQTASLVGTVAGLPASSYGAAYSTLDGRMFFNNNSTGEIYLIDLSVGLSATVFSSGATSSANDGAKILSFDLTNNQICVDCDGDGVSNQFDLDSDNDGIYDVEEAGHSAADANNDGIIDGLASDFGTNGLFDLLETSTDNGILNYVISDSETTPDGTYDACELDSDGDGCFDAQEEDVVDGDTDGIAGTGVPTVNPINGLVTTNTYSPPANNTWQNPLVGSCLPEVCNDGIDNDGDGLVDCYDCADCFDSADCGDNDNDGIGDYCDLDDDNDGITDIDEGCNVVTTFSNVEKGFLFQGDPTQVYTVDIQTGASTLIATLTFRYNGIAINELDGNFWGIDRITNELVILDPTTFSTIFRGNAATGVSFLSGVYDPINKAFVVLEHGASPNQIVIYDADPTSPTYQTILRTFNNTVLSNFVDLAFNVQDGNIYGIIKFTNTLVSFDIVSETVSVVGAVSGLPSGSYGAAYALNDGRMFFGDNNTGEIYVIDLSLGLTATLFSNGPISNQNDGAKFLSVDLDGNVICVDTDGDGIINSLDLDSDNDGCPDAIEGGGSFTYADIQNDTLTGGVSTDGIPLVAGVGQAIGSSQDSTVLSCPEICNDGIDNDGDGLTDCEDPDCYLAANSGDSDHDNDGIGNYCDLDDDNDGIPDIEEQACSLGGNSSSQFNSSLQAWQSTGVTVSEGVVYRITSNGSSLGTRVVTGGPNNGLEVTVNQFDNIKYADLDGYPYDYPQNLKRTNGVNINIGFANLLASDYDRRWTYVAMIDSNGNGQFDRGVDQLLPRLFSEVELMRFEALVGGEMLVVFTDDVYGDNDGNLSFNIETCTDIDTDGDGIYDYLDLDSDNDGIFDLDEAGHTAVDANNDGIIDGANSLFGTNGLFDDLETTPDSDELIYNIANSETSADDIYDAYELDSDGDGCNDADEQLISDTDSDGIAGAGIPSVDANGLVIGNVYTTPINNYWQDPLVNGCFEICNDGIDNDGDGLTDCEDSDCEVVAEINNAGGCGQSSVNFSATDAGAGNTYNWSFGSNATPSSATGLGPHAIDFSNCANQEIVLTVSTGVCNYTDTLIYSTRDSIAPVFNGGAIPADITISCIDPIPGAPVVTATDDCSTPNVTFSQVDNQSVDPCGQNNYTIIRTWVASDLCGNSIQESQTITIEDPTYACSGSGVIGGVAFNDLNNNGVIDDGLGGVLGLEVYLFEDNGGASSFVAQTMTDANGSYSFSTGVTSGTAYRVEFVRPSGMIEDFTRHGTDNGTNVQFVNAPSCSVDVGLADPADYCEAQPFMYVSCYSFGAAENNSIDAIVGLPLNPSTGPSDNGVIGGAVKHLANAEHVGSIYGMAYSKSKEMLYGAAYMKRHVGFGPGGTGAIYQIDPNASSPGASVLVDLNTLFGANTAGADPHPYGNTDTCPGCVTSPGVPDNFNCWQYDTLSWEAVGTISLGDIDASDDGEELFVMNLADKMLYRIDIDNPAATTRYAFPEGDITCMSGGEVRPFAVEFENNKVYVGAICDQVNSSTAMLYVYELDLSTSTWRRVLEANYQRASGSTYETFYSWGPFRTYLSGSVHYTNGNHPLLSDISFDNDAMVLAIRDMTGDQYGNNAGRPDRACDLLWTASKGDIFRAGYNPSTDQYEMESDATVNGITTGGLNFGYGLPGSGGVSSYYFEDIAPNGATQIALGGLAQLPGGDLYISAYDVLGLYDFGIAAFDNQTGARAQSYQMSTNTNTLTGFGKANGLGDLEFGCEEAPVEIGNRVWYDANENGIQDVTEAGIPGITIVLYNSQGDSVSTQITDGLGEYYFSDLTMGDSTLRANETYYIVVQGAEYNPSTNVLLDSLILTDPNIGQAPNTDINDSDAVIGESPNPSWTVDYPFIEITTGNYGESNHNADFGFKSCFPDANPATLTTCDNSNMTGSGLFILHDANPTVSTESGIIISYHLTLSDAQNDINILVSPYTSSDGTVYVRVERISTGCFETALITLDVGTKCPENCANGIDDDGDGLIDCADPDCPCCKASSPTLNGTN